MKMFDPVVGCPCCEGVPDAVITVSAYYHSQCDAWTLRGRIGHRDSPLMVSTVATLPRDVPPDAELPLVVARYVNAARRAAGLTRLEED